MRPLLPVLLLLAGCAGFGSAPQMLVASSCRAGDLEVEVEVGLEVDCATELAVLAGLRAQYELRFGAVESPPVRLRAIDDLGNRAAARTYADAIDLSRGHERALPHELNHVRLGPGSWDHHGWCADFGPWQEATLDIPAAEAFGCH